MSGIVDVIEPGSLILFNESFAGTNEREGSEIARQIMEALLESGVTVACVTHLYSVARGLYERRRADAVFMRGVRGRRPPDVQDRAG